MSNTDRFSMLERWADGMEKLEQYYEGIYGPPATPAQLPPITTYDAMLEAIADGMERAKRNINKKSPTYHSDGAGYVKTVPAGDVHYASLEQIGGKTVVWNQIVDSGTTSVTLTSGHIYYTLISDTASIVTGDGSAVSVTGGTDMVCDLTLMFGSGNEPASTSDFKAIFPAAHYPYNKGSLVSAGVTGIVSQDSDDAVVDTYPIPAEVQALEGYGWSAESVKNYIDFDRKVFVQQVERFDLGSKSYSYYSNGTAFFCAAPSDMKSRSARGAYGICPNYTTAHNVGSWTTLKAMDDAVLLNTNLSSNNRIYIRDDSFDTDAEGRAALKESLQGVYLYYELDEPVEIDISAYLTDDNLISVDSGGTLTFPNANGDDYRIDVPSSVTFVVGEP